MSAKATPRERLSRLLYLVPYVARHPGAPVDEVARALGLSRAELLEDLDLLTLVGHPPFQPDDFVDIYAEDDRLFVHLDQRLSAPPRLTAAETAALASAAAVLSPQPGDTLHAALQKLQAVLPAQARERFKDMERLRDAAMGGPEFLPLLSRAIVERLEVSFDYLSAHRAQRVRRQVRPYELFSHRGQWYLSGLALDAGEERMFRLDRLSALTVSDRRFEVPEGHAPRQLPSLESSQEKVRVHFTRRFAAYATERFGPQTTPTPDGGLEVLVPGDSPRWLTQWVLGFGGEARVLEPAWAVEAVRAAAQAVRDGAP